MTAAARECGTKPTDNQPLSQSELAAIRAAEAAEAARAVTISTVWPGDRPRCGNDKHKPRPDRR
jgi:LmbE family N-acetylglucosaminyl deacetylase